MRVNFLDYDLETVNIDLLIDVDRPVPAEVVPVGDIIYIRGRSFTKPIVKF